MREESEGRDEKIRKGESNLSLFILKMVRDLNCPFGGMKASGLGREGGYYSMEFFTEDKTICMAD